MSSFIQSESIKRETTAISQHDGVGIQLIRETSKKPKPKPGDVPDIEDVKCYKAVTLSDGTIIMRPIPCPK